METTTETATGSTQKDTYRVVNEKIIEALEKGIVPWHKPWRDESGHMPMNVVTKRPYRGMNILLLLLAGYEHNLFLTYKQVQGIGAKVKKDEKGTHIAFWKVQENAENAGEEKKVVLRYYTVFNIDQCENIPAHLMPAEEAQLLAEPIRACEDIIIGMPNAPLFKQKEQKAYYDPLHDFVNMPKQKSFTSMEAYYSTYFHEIVHATGHHSRLSRKTLIEMAEFGSDTYSHEELVAEVGTCYLQAITGITSEFEHSAAYLQGWIGKLKNDKRFIFSAATQAQKAVDYILNIQPPEEEKEEE